MIKNIVISLDNDIGKHRRNLLDYSYELYNAIVYDDADKFIKERLRTMWNSGDKNIRGKVGCIASYYNLFKKIVDERQENIIVLEDDIFFARDIDELNDIDYICYLGGIIFHPTSFNKSTDEWTDNFFNTYDFRVGLNTIDYSKFRILGTHGIYIPSYLLLLPIIENLENSKYIKAIDNHLVENRLINHFIFPAICYHDDSTESQIQSKGKQCGLIVNYRVAKKSNLIYIND